MWVNAMDPHRLYKPDPTLPDKAILKVAGLYRTFPSVYYKEPFQVRINFYRKLLKFGKNFQLHPGLSFVSLLKSKSTFKIVNSWTQKKKKTTISTSIDYERYQ
jgi:hypothetical protein